MLSQHESEILNDLDQRLSFLSGSALPSALRVANFQNKKDSIKESLWDQGSLVAAIPTEWKNILNQNNSHLNAPHEDLPSTCVAYSTLLTNNVSPPTSENRILNYGFSKESIHKVYTLPFLITKDSKLIAFQFKIIHHILLTKSSLLLKATFVPYAPLKSKQ